MADALTEAYDARVAVQPHEKISFTTSERTRWGLTSRSMGVCVATPIAGVEKPVHLVYASNRIIYSMFRDMRDSVRTCGIVLTFHHR